MKKILTSILALVWMCASAQAATYHVKTTGNNTNNDCTAAQTDTTPKATLGGTTGAAQCASAGDTIEIWAGTYTAGFFESAQTLANGSAGNPITVKNHGTDVVWLAPTTGQQVVNLTTKDYWVFDGINVNGRQLNSGGAAGTHGYSLGSGTDHITLKNLRVLDVANNSGLGTGGIGIFPQGNNHLIQNVEVDGTHKIGGASSGGDYLGSHCIYAGDDAENTLIERSHLHNCGGLGMQFNDATTGSPTRSNNVIRQTLIHNYGRNTDQTKVGISLTTKQVNACAYNNIIYAGPGVGITVYGSGNADNCVYNNTIIGQAGSCMRIGPFTAALRTLVKNNLCRGNGEGIRIYASAQDTVLDSNLLWNTTSGYATPVIDGGQNTTITHNILGDPLLLNAGAQPPDVHLTAGSSAINAGVDLFSTVAVDYAGTARTAHAGGDTLFEVGAYTVVAEVLPLKLVFATPPASGTVVGATFTVVVQILDTANTPQDIDSGDITIAKTTGSGTLGGTLTATPTNGVATFSNLTLDAADDDYTLTVTRASTDPATSPPFTVVAAPSSTVQYFQLR